MPEQLTKHPDVTLQVLRSAGVRCGEGAKQEILTQCPAQRFCKLPGGEVCIFGLPDAPSMTQITPAEWKALVRSLPADNATAADAATMMLSGGGGVIAGAVIALAVSRWRRHRGPAP